MYSSSLERTPEKKGRNGNHLVNRTQLHHTLIESISTMPSEDVENAAELVDSLKLSFRDVQMVIIGHACLVGRPEVSVFRAIIFPFQQEFVPFKNMAAGIL